MTDRTVSPGPVIVVGMDSTKVTYWEAAGPDPAALRTFYGEVLGLPFAPPEADGYHLSPPAEGRIAGGVWDGGGIGNYAVPYVLVEDLEATVEAARAAGAEVLVEPRDHGPTRIAHLADPAGNRVGVYVRRG